LTTLLMAVAKKIMIYSNNESLKYLKRQGKLNRHHAK